ncbi:putative beta-cubebene synthase [Dioscorea sansibarensis]
MEVVSSGRPPSVINNAMKPSFKVGKNEDVICRPIANFHPSPWGDYFITNPSLSSIHEEQYVWMKQRIAELIRLIKVQLKDAGGSLEKMELIDALQRLGVAYHFEVEIGEELCLIRSTAASSESNDDLHTVALRFRLLRQHNCYMPSEVFNRFMDDESKYKEEMRNDLEGLLSLYEAAYLGIPGEDQLDEAIDFTRSHLKSLVKDVEPRLARKIEHALETPLRRRMNRLNARLYMSIYEEDIETRNDDVLELAKLDFDILQLLHREEVKNISIWWNDLGFTTKHTFIRDRIVEAYFWILGVYFEPQYSKARMMTVKVIAILSVMDDAYDSYGTLRELQLFTLAIQRWELKQEDQLDENLQLVFMAICNTMKELEDEALKDGKLYRLDYLKREFEKAALLWTKEAKWREEGYVPCSLAEHLDLSVKTAAYHVLAYASLLGIEEEVTRETLEWATSFPPIMKYLGTIARLMDDAADSEFEAKREHVATAISSCMKVYGDTWEEAKLRILGMVEDAWKDMNRECLHLSNIIPSYVLDRFVNLACMMETMFRSTDAYTESMPLIKPISLVLVEPIDHSFAVAKF